MNTVRRHAIVSIVYQRGSHAVEPVAVSSAQFRRYAQLLVVRTSEELHAAAQRLCRDVVGIEAQYTANGIAAVEQGRRAFDDLGAIDRKLVNLQSVVVAPLLSLVLDAIFAHHHAVIAQAADRRLRLS